MSTKINFLPTSSDFKVFLYAGRALDKAKSLPSYTKVEKLSLAIFVFCIVPLAGAIDFATVSFRYIRYIKSQSNYKDQGFDLSKVFVGRKDDYLFKPYSFSRGINYKQYVKEKSALLISGGVSALALAFLKNRTINEGSKAIWVASVNNFFSFHRLITFGAIYIVVDKALSDLETSFGARSFTKSRVNLGASGTSSSGSEPTFNPRTSFGAGASSTGSGFNSGASSSSTSSRPRASSTGFRFNFGASGTSSSSRSKPASSSSTSFGTGAFSAGSGFNFGASGTSSSYRFKPASSSRTSFGAGASSTGSGFNFGASGTSSSGSEPTFSSSASSTGPVKLNPISHNGKTFGEILYEINEIEKIIDVPKIAHRKKRELAYLILGVQPNTDLKTVRKTMLKLIGKYHPDKFISKSDEIKKLAETLTGKINNAYELIAPKPKAELID